MSDGRAYITVGLGFGDEGKGATVDYLCNPMSKLGLQVDYVVRYNGGPQCGHNVYGLNKENKVVHHTFSQFGSGSFHEVDTLLSRYMLIDPLAMIEEANALEEKGILSSPWDYMFIEPQCLVISPFQKILNKIQMMYSGRLNSTGRGVGVCRRHSLDGHRIQVEDMLDKEVFAQKLLQSQSLCCSEMSALIPGVVNKITDDDEKMELFTDYCNFLSAPGVVELLLDRYEQFPAEMFITDSVNIEGDLVFEGAQGFLLDETYGQDDYNTWTNTTAENAHGFLDSYEWSGERRLVGVTRTYRTRHGEGPMSLEHEEYIPDENNNAETGPGPLRTGGIFTGSICSAQRIIGPIHTLAVNHMDVCSLPQDVRQFVLDNQNLVDVIIGRGPTARDREVISREEFLVRYTDYASLKVWHATFTDLGQVK